MDSQLHNLGNSSNNNSSEDEGGVEVTTRGAATSGEIIMVKNGINNKIRGIMGHDRVIMGPSSSQQHTTTTNGLPQSCVGFGNNLGM